MVRIKKSNLGRALLTNFDDLRRRRNCRQITGFRKKFENGEVKGVRTIGVADWAQNPIWCRRLGAEVNFFLK